MNAPRICRFYTDAIRSAESIGDGQFVDELLAEKADFLRETKMPRNDNERPLKTTAHDPAIDHPPHYCSHPTGIEAITICEHFGFNVGNAIKYLWRAGHKGALIDDLKKSRWYVDREIARLADQPNDQPTVSEVAR